MSSASHKNRSYCEWTEVGCRWRPLAWRSQRWCRRGPPSGPPCLWPGWREHTGPSSHGPCWAGLFWWRLRGMEERGRWWKPLRRAHHAASQQLFPLIGLFVCRSPQYQQQQLLTFCYHLQCKVKSTLCRAATIIFIIIKPDDYLSVLIIWSIRCEIILKTTTSVFPRAQSDVFKTQKL